MKLIFFTLSEQKISTAELAFINFSLISFFCKFQFTWKKALGETFFIKKKVDVCIENKTLSSQNNDHCAIRSCEDWCNGKNM